MNMTLKTWLTRYDYSVENIQHTIVPLLLLFCRLWVAWAFFNSGLVKIASWDSTLYLFELEYQVPILPWELAAYLGTAAELTLPIFVALGLLSRPMALALFIFNIVAVISYPVLWEQGFYDHQLWGLMLLLVVVWGAGPISLDKVLRQQASK
ncbi:DoxX family protein [Vibrio aestuarianus]|uniref:DoxX family protein n=2 Tax=Vibrio aestuarianus TaxID=28171 RepID=A0AAX3U1K4_9VIBR|nr:DoxX family protein [Vibrio aestuarianus]MDE1264245.1 DoxX family protein [Vibrio aestuarianus]MDE1295986.1 DoxX family protein [Vibrio aestuarianus]WGK81370.1 DoxX family protein [Vibrio aestuarianus]WGK85264.1 DoxX family protein [Vibrio aestuarianus]CAH8222026.1 putative DoxX protein [Vibrio aestuarianus]